MKNSPATQPSLLVRIRDTSDSRAWSEFVDIYTPLVFGFLRRRGLQDSDAADVTQEVFRGVSKSIESFKHGNGHGSFRSWLLAVTHNKLCDHASREQRQLQGQGDTQNMKLLAEQPVNSDEQELIEREYAQRLFEQACCLVQSEFRTNTWQAFWRTQAEGRSASETAAEFDMTVEAVYVARSRVMARLRERISDLQD